MPTNKDIWHGVAVKESKQRKEGDRIENTFRTCYAKGFTMVVLIGSDSPDLTMNVIEGAFEAIEKGNEGGENG